MTPRRPASGCASSLPRRQGATESPGLPLKGVAQSSAAVLVLILALATVSDLRTRLIPNRLTLGGALVLLACACWSEGTAGTGLALAGGIAAAAAPGLVHIARPEAMGGGDVKLSFAIGCGLGPAGALAVALASLIVLIGALARVPFEGSAALRSEVPFAPYLAAGALAALCVS